MRLQAVNSQPIEIHIDRRSFFGYGYRGQLHSGTEQRFGVQRRQIGRHTGAKRTTVFTSRRRCRKSQYCYIFIIRRRRSRQLHLYRPPPGKHGIDRSNPLHTHLGCNPGASGHITVGDMTFKGESQPFGLQGRENQHLPPLGREGIESPGRFLVMHLVVIDHASDAGAAIGFQVGRNPLTGSLGFAMKPPHLGTGRVGRHRKNSSHLVERRRMTISIRCTRTKNQQ